MTAECILYFNYLTTQAQGRYRDQSGIKT